MTRRQLLLAAGAGTVGALIAGNLLDVHGVAVGSAQAAGTPGWRSRPDLRIPTLEIARCEDGVATEPIFLAPYNAPVGQVGAVIARNDGEAIWEHPLGGEQMTNLRVQRYGGQDVLTWWQGHIELGHGVGRYVILDGAYRVVRTVQAARGLRGDLHEFIITPEETALLTSYLVRRVDLSRVGGPKAGTIQDAILQELDLATGRVLLEWRSLDHIALSESYAPVTADWDFFHMNSIDVDADGNLLVSARSTHTIYKLDRHSGRVLWRLGGARSDFAMGAGTRFAWQHDARRRPDGLLSVFDNGSSPAVEPRSRALLLDLDETSGGVALAHAYTHAGILSESQGSVQVLPGGNVFVGWGQEPYVSEFDASGRLLFHARLGESYESYRALRLPWVGTPAQPPALAAYRVGPSVEAYASWNGATELAAWRLSTSAGQTLATVPASGFETPIGAITGARRVRVQALDAGGGVLATSAAVIPRARWT